MMMTREEEEKERTSKSSSSSSSKIYKMSPRSISTMSSTSSSSLSLSSVSSILMCWLFISTISTRIELVSSFAYQNRVHIGGANSGGNSNSNLNNNNNNYYNGGGAGASSIGELSIGQFGPSDRQGCYWQPVSSKTLAANSNSNSNSVTNSSRIECHLRTINVDLWSVNNNYNYNPNNNNNNNNLNNGTPLTRQDFERASSLKIKCNEKLFFDSFLLPNQTLFSLINLRGIDIESCKIRRLPGNVWTTLSFLKSLAVVTRNSDWSLSVSLELENEAFEGLGQLEHLNLAHNNIFNIPERLFCPLRSLAKLNLSHNRLSELEELNWSSERGQYCTLGVQHVDLSHNSLRRLGRIVKWKKIVELRLQNNLIEELDDVAFGELSVLKMVNLSSNRLVAVPPSIFKFNSHLREIYLANNSISALAPAVFSGLEQLVLLDLSRNTLTSQWIRDKMFHGLSRLIVLRLSSNQLSYVDGSIFQDLTSLQSLSLDNNRIESIHPDAFASLNNLHLLLLTNNRITSLDSRVFSHLFLLRQLFLDHNKLRSLEDRLLTNCTNLQDLGLADNLLQEVPLALRVGLKSIQTLDIGENRIDSLTNDSFSGLNSLFGLRMVDNRLIELPRGFCDSLQKLRVLNLAQNRIQRVSPFAFTNCQEIRALRLDTNQLEELPTSLVPQLPNLLWLNVSENRLNSVDYRSIPVGTEWLDLSHNQIETISGFEDSIINSNSNNNKVPSPQLRVLDLSFNKLTSLDASSFPGSLDTLRVNHNRITSVAPDTFIRSYNLRRVELVSNQMETLSLLSLRFPPLPNGRGLPEFYLGRNPWSCSCSMEWLIRANTHVNQMTGTTSSSSFPNSHSNSSPRIVDLDDITCSPVFSRNTSRLVSLRDHQVQSTDFLCPYSSHCFALCGCCEYDHCDCHMQCPDQCSCYHDESWGRNVVDCSNANHIEVPSNSPMDATEIYLDGNNIRELKSHAFIGKKHTRELFLNNSRVEFIRNKTFNGLKSLWNLHLENNLLTELQGFEFADVENLRELYLNNNLIKTIGPTTFSGLKSLQVLRLDGNLLVSLNVWEHVNVMSVNGVGALHSLYLSDNPWSCNCEFIIAFRSWIFSHSGVVKDLTMTTCRMVANQDREDLKVLTSDNLSTAISTICHGPSEKLVNVNLDGGVTNAGSLPGGNFNPHDNILSDEHEVNVNVLNHIPGHEEESSLSSSHLDNNNDNVNMNMNMNGKNVNSEMINSNDDTTVIGSDSGIFWTILVAVIGLVLILLVLVILFRKEIYERLNDKVNPHFLCSPILCCGPRCCRSGNGGSGGCRNEGKKGVGHNHNSAGGGNGIMGDDTEKLFDAYFLYGKRDEDLILEKLTPELEHRVPNFFRLCLHYRDLCLNPSNPWNFEMVMSACDASKRVVLVLSQGFLQSEWQNPEIRASIQFVLSRSEVQKKLIVILLPPLSEHHLQAINFNLSGHQQYPDLAMNLNINGALSSPLPPSHHLNNNKFGFGNASLLKSSTLEYSDSNFWSKFKLLLPTPLHSSISHSADHPMLIPATYTISRHGDTFPHPQSHSERQQQQQQQQQPHHQIMGNSRNNLMIPPSYEQHSLSYANTTLINAPAPPPPSTLLWQAGMKDNVNNMIPSQIQLQTRGILPVPTAPFNESFRRHQQAHFNQHHQQKLSHGHGHGHSHRQPKNRSHSHRHHSHEHQDSNCSNISNNSRQPLQGSPSAGYSSSVETNISSSNEELDHVYSTLDSPMHSPSAHNNMNSFNNSRQCSNSCTCSGSANNSNHTTTTNTSADNSSNNSCCVVNSSGNNTNNPNNSIIISSSSGGNNPNNSNNGGPCNNKLINPYSPTNINNNGDPNTMYFV